MCPGGGWGPKPTPHPSLPCAGCRAQSTQHSLWGLLPPGGRGKVERPRGPGHPFPRKRPCGLRAGNARAWAGPPQVLGKGWVDAEDETGSLPSEKHRETPERDRSAVGRQPPQPAPTHSCQRGPSARAAPAHGVPGRPSSGRAASPWPQGASQTELPGGRRNPGWAGAPLARGRPASPSGAP